MIERGDVYMVSLEVKDSEELMGPVLVVSPEPFNRVTQKPIVLPITAGEDFLKMAGFSVTLMEGKTKGIVRCDQPRALDFAIRKAYKVESISMGLIDEVMAKVSTIFQ